MATGNRATRTRVRRVFCLLVGSILLARGGRAGQTMSAADTSASPDVSVGLPEFDGPPVPNPPAVIARDADGRITIRAVRLTEAVDVDGRLDEAIYAEVPAMSDFVQQEPHERDAATQKTEVWLFFDRENVYVTARCWESEPGRMIVNEMRRDNNTILQNETFSFVFDTFYDRRNSVIFNVNALGGRMDGQGFDERQYSGDWNPIWRLAVGRFEGGWTVEAAVPFKSLRYRSGRSQVWGFNARRINRWKNETSYLSFVPASKGGTGTLQSSMAATLIGLEVAGSSRNVELKPYVTSNLTTNLAASTPVRNELGGDVGADVKYGITQNISADLTYNTDFAQVEADEQQVNLTRFSLFFPEKRDFFLENQGTFTFGGSTGTGGGAGAAGGSGGQSGGASDTPVLFYSRRIGLSQGRAVPILGGGRVTGRAGRFTLGLLDIVSDEDKATGTRATNFSVVRLRRDVLSRSSIGVMATGRSVAESGTGTNEAVGVDGTFAFFRNLAVNTYWAKTRTDGRSGKDTSYRALLDYGADRYGLQLEHLMIGDEFNPETGYLRRSDIRRSFGLFRFSPRTQKVKAVRKFSWTASLAYIENGDRRLESRDRQGEFAIEFQNSDRFSVGYVDIYEFVPQPFAIDRNVTLPVGGYNYASGRIGYTLGQQRKLAGNVLVESGSFYGGRKTAVSLTRARLNLHPQVSIEPTYSINWVDVDQGSFTAQLMGTRLTYTVTPLMFASALLQYNSSSGSLASNIRLRWEYQPGSELFVVYNEQRDALAPSFPALMSRSFIIKINRLFRP
jgi:hypothetical protein